MKPKTSGRFEFVIYGSNRFGPYLLIGLAFPVLVRGMMLSRITSLQLNRDAHGVYWMQYRGNIYHYVTDDFGNFVNV